MAIKTHWLEEEFDIRLPPDCDLTFPILAGEAARRFRNLADSLRQDFHILVSDKQLAMLVLAFHEAHGEIMPVEDGPYAVLDAPRPPAPPARAPEPSFPLAEADYSKSVPLILMDARRDLRMTQAELAAATGVSMSSICKYETGARVPSRNMLFALARALNLDFVKLNDIRIALKNSPSTLETDIHSCELTSCVGDCSYGN